MNKRILAWIALIVFLLLFINLLVFQYKTTETLVVMLFYVLFLVIKKRSDNAENEEAAFEDIDDTNESEELDENTETVNAPDKVIKDSNNQ